MADSLATAENDNFTRFAKNNVKYLSSRNIPYVDAICLGWVKLHGCLMFHLYAYVSCIWKVLVHSTRRQQAQQFPNSYFYIYSFVTSVNYSLNAVQHSRSVIDKWTQVSFFVLGVLSLVVPGRDRSEKKIHERGLHGFICIAMLKHFLDYVLHVHLYISMFTCTVRKYKRLVWYCKKLCCVLYIR